jgi:hypothetical protein
LGEMTRDPAKLRRSFPDQLDREWLEMANLIETGHRSLEQRTPDRPG